jgi:endonuclease YncB( thermonuclease family)
MEYQIYDLISIYNNTHKHKLIIQKIINNITLEYIKTTQMTTTSTDTDFKLVRHQWLARKYATIWRIKMIEKKKTYKPFNLIDYSTWVRVVDVYDGDTCKVLMNYRGHIDQWTVRMNGYDSPEMKPPKTNQNREKEKEAAKKAKEALITHFTNNYIFIKIVGFDKYGRLLVEAYNGHVHINKSMIQSGHGYSYDGGKKKNYNEE